METIEFDWRVAKFRKRSEHAFELWLLLSRQTFLNPKRGVSLLFSGSAWGKRDQCYGLGFHNVALMSRPRLLCIAEAISSNGRLAACEG